jgi:DNA-binding CsgD family transcriptional regulator
MAIPTRQAVRLDPSIEALAVALEDTMPLCAVLFDSVGRVLWLTREAAQRFGLNRHKIGASMVVSGDLEILEAMRQAAFADPCVHVVGDDAVGSSLSRVLSPDERLVVRSCETPESPVRFVLVAVCPESRPHMMSMAQLTDRGLSPREAELALLVGQGHTTDSASRALGITVSTASTYLRRVYEKLRVTNKAELACLLHEL